MEETQALFREHSTHFTIYVVEQKYVVGKGYTFFKSYLGKPNYIDTDQMAKSFIMKILGWINKRIPSVGDMIKICFEDLSPIGIVDIVIAFSKLFMTQEHQAAGPEAIDPIIIQEEKVLKKYINQIINLHKNSIWAPAIIILLKDNNFERAKELLSECPDGIYAKFIRNNEKHELYKIVNTGAENIEGFMTAFSQQCFSTCSNTKHDILVNRNWAEDSKIKKYVPRMMKYRASLLCDEKNEIKNYLLSCILELEHELNNNNYSSQDKLLLQNFLCIAKIFMVFCNDYGGKELEDALLLSKELNNELFKAYIYKYAFFFKEKNIKEQNNLLEEAYNIFIKNGMVDNAIYCKNNQLVRQFDANKIRPKDFSDMIGEATSEVPGLVGMPHLYNNTGIAYMMSAQPDLAMEYFDTGLEYAKSADRIVQKIALLENKLITKSYYNEKIEFKEIEKLIIQIFDGMVNNEQLPFISSRYIMNLLIIASRNNADWTKELLNNYTIISLINNGFESNPIGSGQLLTQLEYINQKQPELNLKSKCIIPSNIIPVTGLRQKIIQKTGLNPFYFFTWL